MLGGAARENLRGSACEQKLPQNAGRNFTTRMFYDTIKDMEERKTGGFTLISGATGGVGGAFARACAERGDRLFLTGRSAQRLDGLLAELRAEFPALIADSFACDLTDEGSRGQMYSYIRAHGYTFSALCNIAGADIQKAFVRYTQEKIAFQCRVNVEAAISLTHFVLERREPSLEIVAMGSISAVYPMPYFAIYSATKKALEYFFLSLRTELRGTGAKVTVVEPGGIYTRPDICKDIEGQGVWGRLSAKTPAYIAKKSLNAVRKNKRLIRPGFWNKFIAAVPRILPLGVRMRFIAGRWKKLEKDAF